MIGWFYERFLRPLVERHIESFVGSKLFLREWRERMVYEFGSKEFDVAAKQAALSEEVQQGLCERVGTQVLSDSKFEDEVRRVVDEDKLVDMVVERLQHVRED